MYLMLLIILVSIIFDITIIKLKKVNLFTMFIKNLVLFITCHLIIHTDIIVIYTVSIYFALSNIYIVDRLYKR